VDLEAVVWRNRFVALLDRSPMPTGVCHLDGTLVLSNPALARVFGTVPSRLRDKRLVELLSPSDHDAFHRLVRDLLAGQHIRETLRVHWFTDGVEHTGDLVVQTVQHVGEDAAPVLLVTLDRRAELVSPPEISVREQEILELVAAGGTSASIARALGITPDGVTYHLTRLSGRFAVPNRTALVARAYALGLLETRTWPPRVRKPLA
jgi:PAS domain S-box-containing protein